MNDTLNAALLLVVALVGAVPAVLIAWLAAGVIRRLSAQNSDLLKANLALSEKPSAVHQAAAMEVSDRIAMNSEKLTRDPARPMRPVGA